MRSTYFCKRFRERRKRDKWSDQRILGAPLISAYFTGISNVGISLLSG